MNTDTPDNTNLIVSDGSSADYYKLPEQATQLQHLISFKDMNAQMGEIFRAVYRYGQVAHSERMRDAKKIKFYIEAEIERLKRLEGRVGVVESTKCSQAKASEKVQVDLNICQRVCNRNMPLYTDPTCLMCIESKQRCMPQKEVAPTPVTPATLNTEKEVAAMTYEDFVANLKKPGSVIKSELTSSDCDVIHMTMGICGEAGELLDAIKKHVIYRKPFDRENAIEELGDLEFYLEGLRQVLKVTREEVVEGNMIKLSKRYKGVKYSDAAAVAREDKES